jgi:hypothetical protein
MPLYVLKVMSAPASLSRLWVSTPYLYATCSSRQHKHSSKQQHVAQTGHALQGAGGKMPPPHCWASQSSLSMWLLAGLRE